jgi:hypothetical protein
MVLCYLIQVVEIVDHQACRLAETLLGAIRIGMDLMDDSPVAQVETCHGIEGHPAAIFCLGQKVRSKRAERLSIDMIGIDTRFGQPPRESGQRG